jgi:hypothetical protein
MSLYLLGILSCFLYVCSLNFLPHALIPLPLSEEYTLNSDCLLDFEK